MPDVPPEVAEGFLLARAFLSGGAKALNKYYEGAVDPEKHEDSIERLTAGHSVLSLPRNHTSPGYNSSYVNQGRLMRKTGTIMGNCVEQSSLAASYLADAGHQQITVIRCESNKVDHLILLVGKLLPTLVSLADLAKVPVTEYSFAVDVWANICSHASQYPELLQEKANKWALGGKTIATVQGPMKPKDWAKTILGGRARWLDAYVQTQPFRREAVGEIEQIAASRASAVEQRTGELQATLQTLQGRREQLLHPQLPMREAATIDQYIKGIEDEVVAIHHQLLQPMPEQNHRRLVERYQELSAGKNKSESAKQYLALNPEGYRSDSLQLLAEPESRALKELKSLNRQQQFLDLQAQRRELIDIPSSPHPGVAPAIGGASSQLGPPPQSPQHAAATLAPPPSHLHSPPGTHAPPTRGPGNGRDGDRGRGGVRTNPRGHS